MSTMSIQSDMCLHDQSEVRIFTGFFLKNPNMGMADETYRNEMPKLSWLPWGEFLE